VNMQAYEDLYNHMRNTAQRPSQDAQLTDTVADWSLNQNRRVLNMLGTSPMDINARFKINRMIRSGTSADPVNVLNLVKGHAAQLMFQHPSARVFPKGFDYPIVPSAYWDEVKGDATPDVWAETQSYRKGAFVISASTNDYLSRRPQPLTLWQVVSGPDGRPLGGHTHSGVSVDQTTGDLIAPTCTYNFIDVDGKPWNCSERGRHYHDPRPYSDKGGPSLSKVFVYLEKSEYIEQLGLEELPEDAPSGTTYIRVSEHEIFPTTAKAAKLIRSLPGIGFTEFARITELRRDVLESVIPRLKSRLETLRIEENESKNLRLKSSLSEHAQRLNIREATLVEVRAMAKTIEHMERYWVHEVSKILNIDISQVDYSHRDYLGTPELKYPLAQASTSNVGIQMRTLDGLPPTAEVQTYLREKLRERGISSFTTLAPAAAVSSITGTPLPLSPQAEEHLLKDNENKKRGSAPAASPDERAWRWLIISYNDYQNALPKASRKPLVPLHKALNFRLPKSGSSAAPKEVISEDIASMARNLLREIKEGKLPGKPVGPSKNEFEDFQSGVTQAMESQAASIKLLTEEILRLRENSRKPATSQSVDSDDETEEVDEQNPSASSAGSEQPVEYSYVDMGEYQCQGRYWTPLVNANEQLSSPDGAYVVARHPLTGSLFYAPFKLDLSVPFTVTSDGFYRSDTLGARQVPSKESQPPKVPKATRPKVPAEKDIEVVEEVQSPGVKAGKARDTGNEQINSLPPLSMYLCPSCDKTRVEAHKESCDLKDATWTRLSKEGKAQRNLYLESPEKALDQKSKPKAPSPSPKKKGKDAEKEEPVDRLEKTDPLKTEKVPLSEGQEKGLKKFFGLKELPSSDILSTLDKDERKVLRSQSEIPKWAISAVRESQNNYNAILSGKLTLPAYQAGKYERQTKPSKEITDAEVTKQWLELKSRFEGTALLENPKSQKEKAFKKAFDLLRNKVGDRAVLPKPKGGNNGNASPAASRQQGSRQQEGGSLRESLLLFVEIAKALKGT